MNHVVLPRHSGAKVLKDGDILNIDVTVIVEGWFGDTRPDVCRGQAGPEGGAAGRAPDRRVRMTR